jgi:hypothetical protein
MSRNALSSRRAWLWLIPAAVAVLAVVVLLSRDRGYQSALATFHVRSSSYAVEMAAVADTLLSHVPVGSPPSAVVALLDSLGFVRSNDAFDLRSAFYIDSTPGKTIYARRPYEDPLLSLDQFVCDAPALRLEFRFDGAWRLAAVEANTARGCI